MVKKPVKTRVSITLTKFYIDGLNELVKRGIYLELQDAIREALRDLFVKKFVNS